MDSNGSTVITGGTSTVCGSPEDREGALDESGTVVTEFTSVKTFQPVVLSAADVIEGSTYTVTVGGQTAGTATAGVEAVGSMSGPGGMGGGAPRP